MKRGVFITGTDTNVGKTVCSAILVSSFLQNKSPVGYWKPIQTGTDSDRATVLKLSALNDANSPSAAYEFPEPMAPSRAAALHGETIDLEAVKNQWNSLPSNRFWVVEGAGGILVPLTDQHTIADLIQTLELPIWIVASTRLGTMNHTMLTVEAARRRSIPIKAISWVGNEDPTLEKSLAPWLEEIPIQTRIRNLTQVDPIQIQLCAKEMGFNQLLEGYGN